MELKTFVSQTLIEILEGVSLAQDKAGELGAKVIPTLAPGGGSIRDIEFDVEVKTAEGTETKGGIGIYVGAIGLGSQGQSNAQTSSVGRIRFAIPVVYATSAKGVDGERASAPRTGDPAHLAAGPRDTEGISRSQYSKEPPRRGQDIRSALCQARHGAGRG